MRYALGSFIGVVGSTIAAAYLVNLGTGPAVATIILLLSLALALHSE